MRKAPRFDRTQYLEQLGHEVMSSDPRSHTYKILRNGRSGQGQEECHTTSTLPEVKNAAGEVVSTLSEWSEVWRQQFEQEEGGHLCTGDERAE